MARHMAELGVIEDYALERLRYRTEGEKVTAQLTYRAELRDAQDCQPAAGRSGGSRRGGFHAP